jgi:hypothetical protein
MTSRLALKKWSKLLLGWSLGGLLLFWLLRHVDVSGIAQSAAQVPAWLWLALAQAGEFADRHALGAVA